MKPLLPVTVVTPTFNRAKLIRRALDSLRNQCCWPQQIIIVDDGSTDGTPDVVRSWASTSGMHIDLLVQQYNGGPALARNRGIESAQTPYIAFLDSDDEQLPYSLEALVGMLQRVPQAILSFGDGSRVTGDNREDLAFFTPHVDMVRDAVALQELRVGREATYLLKDATETLLMGSIIPTSAICFRREAALAAGLMPSNRRSGEDWLFWLRMSMQGPFVFQHRDLVLIHRHDDNLTHERAAEFIARERVLGYLSMLDEDSGIKLTSDQRRRILQARVQRQSEWRYHLSRQGLAAYWRGLGAPWVAEIGGRARELISDPKSLLRAVYRSVSSMR